MKLPESSRDLSRDMKEFDIWITPSLGDITATEKFNEEMSRVVRVFEELGNSTNNFNSINGFNPDSISRNFIQISNSLPQEERNELFKSLASTLYMVTGKTDNNSKCQFPLYLRDNVNISTLPSINSRGASQSIVSKPLPRTIKSDDYMDLVAAIDNEIDQTELLDYFVSFLLNDEEAIKQIWSLGYSYFGLKSFNNGYEKNLLSPLIIYKVRGSVSASGGHKPEEILREYLKEWGLIADKDFNINDVIVEPSAASGDGTEDEKTRAYDFVIPYKSEGWSPEWSNRILIQSQFYAGDSGSVSHKNVDQTSTSRTRVLQLFPSVRFIEYVDGAGYFSSLNGDLKKILSMSTTSSFIQIKSACIKLRRELQKLGFITPLEIEHAISLTDGTRNQVVEFLLQDGYLPEEISRAINSAISNDIIENLNNTLTIKDERRSIVRQYLILDAVALSGRLLTITELSTTPKILIPGYGAFYGIEMDEFIRQNNTMFGIFNEEIRNTEIFMSDIRILASKGFCMIRQ